MNRKQALEASLNGRAERVDGSARSIERSCYVVFPDGGYRFAWMYDAENPNAQWRPEIARGANIVAVELSR